MNKVVQFDASVRNIQKINPLFSKCDIRVLYTGANRNNSFISKDTVDRSLSTIYNIPIVGEFKEAVDDFGGHGGKVEISDAGIKYIQTTKPYGVVPESANVYWQPIADADGLVREYLIVEGAYLWTGRYEEAETIVETTKGQSMEIEVLEGNFNNDDLFVIDDMVFSALCILGNDIDPCFEGANIKAYSFTKSDFKQEFITMMKELKASFSDDVLNSKEVENVAKYTKEYPALTQQEVDEERKQEGYVSDGDAEDKKDGGADEAQEDANGKKMAKQDAEDKTDGGADESEEDANGKKQMAKSKGDGDAEDKIDGGSDEDQEDANGKKKMAKSKGDGDAEDLIDGGADEDQEDANGKKKMSKKEQEIEAYTAQISSLKEDLAKMQEERDALLAFKKAKLKEIHVAQVEELLEQFDKLDDEEIQSIRDVMHNLTISQIEEKLYFMLGKKVSKYSSIAKKKDTVKVEFGLSNKDKNVGGYELSHIFEKYSSGE